MKDQRNQVRRRLTRCLLGLTAGQATPALADVVGRLIADLPQQQTLAVLQERYRLCWSVATLRKVTEALARTLKPLRHDVQVTYLVDLLQKAHRSPGNGRPSLVVGRDSIMTPMRDSWQEASTASITVYDPKGEYMAYARYKRNGLPIGSGVTEAACKTIFTQRFKLSGMRWHKDSGQNVLDLRVILRGGVWRYVRKRWLKLPISCNLPKSAAALAKTA